MSGGGAPPPAGLCMGGAAPPASGVGPSSPFSPAENGLTPAAAPPPAPALPPYVVGFSAPSIPSQPAAAAAAAQSARTAVRRSLPTNTPNLRPMALPSFARDGVARFQGRRVLD